MRNVRGPAHVDEHRVGERRPFSDTARVEIDEVPVETGLEPRGEARRNVRRQHRLCEENRAVAPVAHDPREHVDTGLRQRRLEG